jgi:hypothetical protein
MVRKSFAEKKQKQREKKIRLKQYISLRSKWRHNYHEASMEGPLLRLLIPSRSVNKHGCHRQFLFLIGWYLKNLLLWNCFAKWKCEKLEDAGRQVKLCIKLSMPCARVLTRGDILLDHSTNHLQNTWHFVSDLQWRGVSVVVLVLLG